MTCVFFGEVLIDMAVSEDGALRWSNGGAPANACVGAARAGARSSLVSTVGDDYLGRSLSASLEREGVGLEALRVDDAIPTSLGVFNPAVDAAEGWISYRRADREIDTSQISAIDWDAVQTAYIGAGSFSEHEPVRTAADYVTRARHSDATVVVDCNYRATGWSSAEQYYNVMRSVLSHADVAKLNEVEAQLIGGGSSALQAAATVLEWGPSLVFVTLGAAGSVFRSRKAVGRVTPIGPSGTDLIGTGDAFVGSLTARLAHGLFDAIVGDEQGLFELTAACVESGRLATFSLAGGW